MRARTRMCVRSCTRMFFVTHFLALIWSNICLRGSKGTGELVSLLGLVCLLSGETAADFSSSYCLLFSPSCCDNAASPSPPLSPDVQRRVARVKLCCRPEGKKNQACVTLQGRSSQHDVQRQNTSRVDSSSNRVGSQINNVCKTSG